MSRFAALFFLVFGLLCIGCTPDGQTRAANDVAPAPAVKNTTERALAIGANANANVCETICQRSAELNCGLPKPACLEACRDTVDTPICKTQMAAVMQCVIREPVTHWECSDEKIAAIKDGFCQREQLAFLQCYSAAVAP